MQRLTLIIGVMLLVGCGQLTIEADPAPATDLPQQNAMPGGEPSPAPTATASMPTPSAWAPTVTPTPAIPTVTRTGNALPAAPALPADVATAAPPTLPPAAPATATPGGAVEQPIIDHFNVTSDGSLSVGERVSVSWQVQHARQLALCYGYFQEGEPEDDPAGVAGEHCAGNLPQTAADYTLTLAPPAGGEGNIFYVAFALQVLNGVPAGEGALTAPIKEATAFQAIPATCSYQWFHSLDTGWCPRSPVAGYPDAIGQRFEHGLAIYLPPHGPAPNRLIVLYDDGRTAGAMGYPVEAPPPELEVPAGFLAPAPAFYPLWAQGSSNSFLQALRDDLGWAVTGPASFHFKEQCVESPQDTADQCYLTGPQADLYVIDPSQHRWNHP